MSRPIAIIEQPVQPQIAIAKLPIPPEWVAGFGVLVLGLALGYVGHQGRKLRREVAQWRAENPIKAEDSYKDDVLDRLGLLMETVGSLDPATFQQQYISQIANALRAKGRQPNIDLLQNPAAVALAIESKQGLNDLCLDCDGDGEIDVLQDRNPNDAEQLNRLLAQIESQIQGANSATETRLGAIAAQLEQKLAAMSHPIAPGSNGWIRGGTDPQEHHIAVIPTEGGTASVSPPQSVTIPAMAQIPKASQAHPFSGATTLSQILP